MRHASIGAMRHRVVLQHLTRVQDGGGGATETWEPVAELWASVTTLSGEERLAADQVSGRLTHEVRLRHRSGVTPAMRFVWSSRHLEIRSVIEIDGRYLKCLCTERDL